MTHPLPRPVVRLAARVLVPLVTGAALLGATGAAAAATTLHRGSTGSSVTTLQRYLDKNARADYFHYDGVYTSTFGAVTTAGLTSWQKAEHRTATGRITVGSTAWKALSSQYRAVARLDKRCLTSGLVVCVTKNERRVYVLRDGAVIRTFAARFGAASTPTREGTFHIFRISGKNAVSSQFHTPMPYAMTFSGGQALHYSPDFAARGYAGASHGCVNLRDYAGVRWLNGQVHIGTKVVVYR